jgi:hypothetical protein
MIDVFKTNVYKKTDALELLDLLGTVFPDATINFDLTDIDKILRVHADPRDPGLVIATLNKLGFSCIELE